MKFNKKLYKHGGSLALIIPAEFTQYLSSNEVDIELSFDGENNPQLVVEPASKPDSIENDPLFPTFIEALYQDAMENPNKLKSISDIPADRLTKLIEGIDVDAQ